MGWPSEHAEPGVLTVEMLHDLADRENEKMRNPKPMVWVYPPHVYEALTGRKVLP